MNCSLCSAPLASQARGDDRLDEFLEARVALRIVERTCLRRERAEQSEQFILGLRCACAEVSVVRTHNHRDHRLPTGANGHLGRLRDQPPVDDGERQAWYFRTTEN